MMKKYLYKYIPYIIIGVVFFLLDRENLFINDDLNYAMNHVTGEPVRNMFDAIQSQSYDWFHQNGRFIIHTLVQCFCGFLGSKLFWICNTLVFLLWLKGIVSYLDLTLNKKTNSLGILLLGTVLMIPAWNITNLGYISGAVNYLWGGCAYLWFIIWYLQSKELRNRIGIVKGIGIFITAMVVGSLQESFCIGIAVYLGIYYMFNIKELRGKIAYMVIGFCLGAAICVLAPANFERLGGTESKSIGLLKYVSGFAIVLTNASTLVATIVVCFILWCTKKYRRLACETIVQHSIILSAACINALFVAIVAYTGPHQLTGIELFSLLVLMSIIYKLWLVHSIKVEKILNYVAYTILLALCIPVWQQRASISRAYDILVENAKETKDGIVVASDYLNEISQERNWLRSKFVRSQEDIIPTAKWLSRYLTDGKNECLIQAILPNEPYDIAEECNEENLVSNNIYKMHDANYYVVKVDKQETPLIRVSSKVTFFGEIRNRLQTGNPYQITGKQLHRLFSFELNDVKYFIEIDDNNYPIQDIEIISSIIVK